MSNKKAYSYLFALTIIALSACSKKQFDPVAPTEKKNQLGNLVCDPNYPEYIHAYFNTLSICFNSITNARDTFSNAYYKDNVNHQDHISLSRKNLDATMSCQIHFINPDLHNKTLPYVLPHAAPGYNEYSEIVLSNLANALPTSGNEDYVGSTYKGFQITITDTTGGYLTGTFGGNATTKSGKKLQIDNGEFYVKVIDINKN